MESMVLLNAICSFDRKVYIWSHSEICDIFVIWNTLYPFKTNEQTSYYAKCFASLGKMPKPWTHSSFLIVQKDCANLFYPPWYMYTWISIWKIKYLWLIKITVSSHSKKIMLYFVHCAIITSTYQCIVKVPNLLGTPTLTTLTKPATLTDQSIYQKDAESALLTWSSFFCTQLPDRLDHLHHPQLSVSQTHLLLKVGWSNETLDAWVGQIYLGAKFRVENAL